MDWRNRGERPRHTKALIAALSITVIVAWTDATAAFGATPSVDTTIGTSEPTEGSIAGTDDGSADGESRSSVARLRLGGEDILEIGGTSSGSGPSGSGSDATVISVLGNEIVGSESSSERGATHATTGILDEICEATGGVLCLALLYGDSQTTGGSQSDAYAALATACVNGNQKHPSDACDGVVSADVAESMSSSSSGASGSSAEQSSVLARLCIADDASTPACDGVGAVVLESSGSSDGTTTSRGVAVEAGGDEVFATDHPTGIGSCDGSADNCLLLNDGDATGGSGGVVSAGSFEPAVGSASAEGVVVDIRLMDQEILRLSGTGATSSSDGSASDVTVLSVLGHEVMGAHATSGGGTSTSETGYATESCAASDGALCLALLYGRATASEDADSSSGSSDAALASLCAGGSQGDPTEQCDGPVGLTVGESHSRVSQDKGGPSAQADQWSSGVDICLGGENAQGTCDGLGATVLSAESHSSAAPGSEDGDADASTLTVEAQGEEQAAIDQPGTIAVPPDCPSDGSLVCLTLNDADSRAKVPSGTALDVVLGTTGDGAAGEGKVSRGETGASVPPRVLGQGEQREVSPGALPRTGFGVAALVIIALSALGVGLRMRRQREHGARP